MNDETNTEQVEKQQELDMPENETEEVTQADTQENKQADTQANEEEVPVMEEEGKSSLESTTVGETPLNDEQQHEDTYDFGSSPVTDGEIFTPDKHQDETVTEQSDTTKGFIVSEFGGHSNSEQQHEGSDDFEFYEKFFKAIAERDHLQYSRNEENPDFEIYLKPEAEADENTTHIQIDHDRNLTMTAKDKKNNETVVPDQQRFDDIAELAWEQGNYPITFGNIETPEYAARLYIACKTHQPPIKMIEAPDIDSLKDLTLETKARLDEIAAKETESKQDLTYDEAPTDNQEEDPVAEYDNNSNSVDNNATEHTEQNTPSTSESEGVQSEKEVEVVPSQKEEASKPTNDFATNEEVQQHLTNVWSKLKQNQSQEQDSLNKEQNNLNTKEAQTQTNADIILQKYQNRVR